MRSDEDRPGNAPRAVSRRAFIATAAGLAAAWAAESVAAPRKRRHGDPHAPAKGRHKGAAPAAGIEKDKATTQQTVDALRKFEVPQATEPAASFAALPPAGRR